MADQFLTPGWYLQLGSWPYWAANGLATFGAPQNDAWSQNPSASDSKGGILGILTEPTASLDRSQGVLAVFHPTRFREIPSGQRINVSENVH